MVRSVTRFTSEICTAWMRAAGSARTVSRSRRSHPEWKKSSTYPPCRPAARAISRASASVIDEREVLAQGMDHLDGEADADRRRLRKETCVRVAIGARGRLPG